MIFGVGQAIQLAAILKSHGDIPFARQLHNVFNASVLPAARDYDAVEGAASLQGLAHSVYSRQPIHLESSRQPPAAQSIH
jgi:hypothetical protein